MNAASQASSWASHGHEIINLFLRLNGVSIMNSVSDIENTIVASRGPLTRLNVPAPSTNRTIHCDLPKISSFQSKRRSERSRVPSVSDGHR